MYLPPGSRRRYSLWSVDLKVSGGGAVLPAARRLHDDGAAQRTRPIAVEPQTQAVLAEHMLQDRKMTFVEVETANERIESLWKTLLITGFFCKR